MPWLPARFGESSLVHLGRRPQGAGESSTAPDWKQADPERIARALRRALARSGGGWFVLGDRAMVERGPRRYDVLGHELVAWHDGAAFRVAPAACPHMGADLSAGRLERGRLICPWHGLALGAGGHGRWQCFNCYDDSVLLWVQLPDRDATELTTDRPIVAPRPARFLSAVIDMAARCDPEDILANRLDPWHGAHYHPHSFAALRLHGQTDDVLTLRVSFRVAGRLAVEVDCTFHSPEPRTITMTIIAGEGVGSVVETHATPTGPGHCRVVEATLATSDRAPPWLPTALSKFARPFMEARARRLWVEDIAYAERRYRLRTA